jgi:hypothetical protein
VVGCQAINEFTAITVLGLPAVSTVLDGYFMESNYRTREAMHVLATVKYMAREI